MSNPKRAIMATSVRPLDYAERCQRYARQRGWTYDPQRLSIGRLTPRQRRRAIKKEWHQSPGYSRRAIDMPWHPRYAGYNFPELSAGDFDPWPYGDDD